MMLCARSVVLAPWLFPLVMRKTVIHPSAIIERGAQLGAGVEVGPFSIIGAGAILHDEVVVHSHVSINSSVTLGQKCEIFPHVVLGQAPQDVKYKGEDTRLVLGKRNILREHVTMHPGTRVGNGITQIGNDGYFMVGAHVGHDCQVGDHVVLSNSAALGGYVQVGDHANLGGLVGVHQFTRIGHHAFVGALSYVANDVIPYGMVTGNPGHLRGLNIVGMQRANMERSQIRQVRAVYQGIFGCNEGVFADRVKSARQTYSELKPALDVIDFIQADALRPLCLPDAE
jgi:UDP-N-acetylglucosamine acyltransferase